MKYWFFIYLLFRPPVVFSQVEHPVKWEFSVKRLSSQTYVFKALAKVNKPWHIYAQHQPVNAISTPTQFRFDEVSNLLLVNTPKEIGKMIKYIDKENDISSNEYEGIIIFTQVFKMTNNLAKKLTGTVTFQACTNEECLQPEDLKFSVEIKAN